MKKLIFLSFAILLFSGLKAQNLVPNPSFEEYTLCPDYQGQINRLLDWYNPTQCDPDFLSECATNSMVSIPENFVGTQNARTGINYSGLGSCFWTFNGAYPALSEYIQVQLIQPLQIDRTYYVSFYVSLADSSEYYTKSIAANFSDTATFLSNPYTWDLKSHIIANYDLNKTSEWQKIEGYYHAHGGEQFLTIGYFKNDTSLFDTLKFQNVPTGGILDTSFYYYLDDVLIVDSLFQGISEIHQNQISVQNYLLSNQNNYTLYSNELQNKGAIIEIFDLPGNTIFCKIFSEKNYCSCINLHLLKDGMYIYRININNTITQQGKILIIKN